VLYRGVLLTELAALALACFSVWQELWAQYRGSRCSARRIFVYLVALLFILVVFRPLWTAPLYPPTAFDATMYHLAIAKLDVQTHSLVFTPYIRFSTLPQQNEMLFALMLSVFDDVSAQLVQFLMMLLIGVALYAWGRRWFNKRVGLWAAILWLSNPLVIWLAASAYVDVGVALFVTLGILSFFNWQQTKEEAWLILSDAFLAFGAASKYTGLFPLCIFGLSLLYLSVRRRQLRQVLIFAVFVAAIAAPWYIRNYHLTGNPIFPEAGSIFGYGPWNAKDADNHVLAQAAYGSGKTLKALFLLPWHLAFRQEPFTYATITPIYFFLLPFVFVSALRSPVVRALMFTTVALVLSWFYSVQILRFLLVAIPIFSLAGAASLEDLIPGLRGLASNKGITALGALILLGPAWNYITVFPKTFASAYAKKLGMDKPSNFWWPELFAPLPTTAKQRYVYLEQQLPGYPALELLNRTRGRNYTLYALGDTQLAYFADGKFMGDWFGPARYGPILDAAVHSDPQALSTALKDLGAQYLVVDLESFSLEQLLHSSFLTNANNHLKLINATPQVLLFEVLDHPSLCSLGPELLINPGFEKLSEAKPENWAMVGNPRIDSSAHFSHKGNAAVASEENDYLFQRVAVQPGHLYILSNFSRVTDKASVAHLQINWFHDNLDQAVAVAIKGVSENSQWEQHSMAVTAPNDAAWADVYASIGGPGSVWFDDFSFSELVCE
jgi:hypothetical protein